MWDQRYRRLKKGEVIEEGDEIGNIWTDENGELIWKTPNVETIGTTAPDPQFTSHRWFRRLKRDETINKILENK